MPSIIGKKQGNKTYYYLVESARVGGKPRIVSQRYLGPAEEIVARLSGAGPGEPDRTRHLAFGDIAAIWSVLERLKVAEIVDEVVGPRRADAGASVGTYIALAALNRVTDPCSKLAFADWWAKTAGDRWLRLPTGALDHRRFWEAMDAISEEQLKEVERRIVARMVESFGIDLSGLVLDMTNFATYIDSANERAPIAQRGHAKQKRTDLRIVGLGLVVSTDGGVPLVSHAYAGNSPDVTQFPSMVNELVARFEKLLGKGKDGGGKDKLTLVFDAGQNSEDNYDAARGRAAALRRLAPTVGPPRPAGRRPRTATRSSTKSASRASRPSRRPRSSSAPSAVWWSATRRTSTPNSPRASTRHLPRHSASWVSIQARLARGKTRKAAGQGRSGDRRHPEAPLGVPGGLGVAVGGESPAELRLNVHREQESPGRLGRGTVRQADPLQRQGRHGRPQRR